MFQMTNRYPGKCADCGLRVPAGAGTATELAPKTWRVTHLSPAACEEAKAAAPPAAVAAAQAPDPDIPAGRYAVPEGAEIGFYRVDRPTAGRWQGWTFVKRVVGPEEVPIRHAEKAKALAAIAVDPDAALLRYGREIGECGVCGTQLTVGVSRAAGIGPTCAKNRGLDQAALARANGWNPAAALVEADAVRAPALPGLEPAAVERAADEPYWQYLDRLVGAAS